MNSLAPLLAVADLTLSRGERQLFAGMSFSLAPGDLLLVRGPNGAGKSSLLLTLAGVLRPDRGSVNYAGDLPRHVLAHAMGVKARLTLNENLQFWRTVNGPDGIAPDEALAAVGLGGLGGIEAGHLSAGQTKRLALARLLVTDRKLWLLDEPTASLDAAGDGLVAKLIAERQASGGAVIAATHDDIAGATGTLLLGAPV